MQVLSFRWRAKYGHFLRAEANVCGLTYPLPPKTAVLGLLGAILGLEKDSLARDLGPIYVATTGAAQRRFWHRAKLRKDPPAALPWTIKKNQKGTDSPEKATLNLQEWLLDPDFLVHVALPERAERFAELVNRIRERRWHFTPCMGLSELLAEVDFIACQQGRALGERQRVHIQGACLASEARLRTEAGLGVQLLRMPRSVSEDRIFTHAAYYVEHRGRSFPVETDAAWQVGDWVLMFS